MNKKEYKRGLKLGVPIGMGYFSVSFAFGMMAVGSGLSPLATVMISMTNLTSAGQFAGVGLIVSSASYIEIILTMLMINARYFLMSLSVSQKMDKGFRFRKKLMISFGITDEIFTVAALEEKPLTEAFLWGLLTVPYIGWTMGTLSGSVMSKILPYSLQDALGIALYGMFIALIIPAAKASRAVLVTLIIAISCSCILKYAPFLSQISSGFAVIIVTVIAAGTAAYLFPLKDEEEAECTSHTVSS